MATADMNKSPSAIRLPNPPHGPGHETRILLQRHVDCLDIVASLGQDPPRRTEIAGDGEESHFPQRSDSGPNQVKIQLSHGNLLRKLLIAHDRRRLSLQTKCLVVERFVIFRFVRGQPCFPATPQLLQRRRTEQLKRNRVFVAVLEFQDNSIDLERRAVDRAVA
jgi:hypothetical protein